MHQTFKRKIVSGVITLALIALAFFAIAPLLAPSIDSDGTFAALSTKIAFAFGGDGGGDGGGGGGDGSGGTDGPGCCGDGGGTDTGPGDTSGDTPAPVIDVCPNIPGAQPTIPPGYVMNGSNCVIPPPPSVCDSLTATPTTLPVGGGNVTLTWRTTGATAVSINQGVGSVPVDGTRTVNNVTSSRTFVLTATGPGGTDTCQVSVVVPNPPALACDSFTASPTNLPVGGGSVTLTWRTTGATSVSINQGVGSVAVDGSVTVNNVTSSRTFVLTATSASDVDTCQVSVVVPHTPILACDSLTASPTNLPAGGGNVTLTWRTTGATSVSINHGIGSQPVDGSTTINVNGSRTFILTATGAAGTVTCQVPVTVAPTPLACDSFTASPTNLPVGGGNVTLTWRTTGATAVSINQGIGAVAVDGTRTVNVNSSRTFVLTATRGADTVTCSVPVTVQHQPQPFTCDAFNASPSHFDDGGGNTTLSWETTGATRVVIDQGIGEVSLDGSRSEFVSSSRTYTLTATRGAQTVTCTTSVTVDRDDDDDDDDDHDSPSPRCIEFRASDRDIDEGDTVTLSWETRNGTRIEIEPNVLDTTDDDLVEEGEIVVRPTHSTEYELTVYRGSRKDTCEVDVTVDDIEIITEIDQQPVTSISFKEIPYTGFDAGPFLTSLFYTLLALWSAVIAYILVVKRGSVLGFSLPAFAPHMAGSGAFIPPVNTFYAPQHDAPVVARTATAPNNLPFAGTFATAWKTITTDEDEEEETTDGDDLMSRLENDAHAHNVLLSSDAMRLIIDHGETPEESVSLLDTLIERAKANFAREDGWIVLNRERVLELLKESAEVAPVVAPAVAVGAHTLAEAIVTQNTARAYEALAEEPLHAIADAAEALDSVLRARAQGAASSDMLARAAAHIPDQQLKAAISTLVTAIDGTYVDEAAAVRLAVIKALKATA